MKKLNRKHLALSIVAFILVLMVTVGATYAWIDDIKLVEFQNDDLTTNGAPLKTGVDINSTVNITKENNSVNLGNMLSQSDLVFDGYTYNSGQDNEYTGKHTKYKGGSSEPDWDYIDNEKGYFYESGDMHLSGCYSDGETFYFPTSDNGYREGNKDDENVNYISFTAKVSSPDANVDFWFLNEPAIYVKGTNNKIANARFAISVDGKSHVYSSNGKNKQYNGSSVNEVTVRQTTAYVYNHDNNTTEESGKNSNTLFSIKKGGTVNMTVKIWLENGFDTNITASDINMELVSSWAYSRTIKIVDRTTTNTSKSWLNNDSATMFLTCPEVLTEYAQKCNLGPNVSSWQLIRSQEGYDHAPFFQLQSSGQEDGYDVYTVTMPMIYNGEEMIIYRCSNSGWNTGSHRGSKGDNEDDISPTVYYTGDYDVTYWNWWESRIPNTYTTGVYTLYGGSHDKYAGYVVGRDTDSKYRTYLGYGTWGAVEEISVEQNYNEVNWASYGSANDNVYIRDYSDYETSGETYVHSMFWDSTANLWKATVPQSSALLQFLYTQNSVIKGCYGYHSYNNDNPQMRPEGSVKYHFVFKNDKSSNVNGIGYWNGANHVYLIKNGNIASQSTVDTYFYYKYKNGGEKTFENKAWPGTSMTLVSGVSYQGSSVYVSDELYSSNGNNVYPDRRKSNESDNANKITVDTTVVFNNGSSGVQSPDKIVYPGCYYDFDNNIWLGSLTGTSRSGVVTSGDDSGGDSGGESGGGTISGYTIDSGFTFKINNIAYTAYTNSEGNEFKVAIPLSAGSNWTTIQKNGKDYGLEASGQEYNVPNSNLNLFLVKGRTNNISLKASSAGTYIATFKYDNGNTDTICISSILAES